MTGVTEPAPENLLGISDPGFAASVAGGLAADFERSREIKPDEFGRRGLGARGLERVSRLLIEQY